ncbi:MAG: FHA domain-containing protein [Chitinophagaceae bacterium]
MTKEESLVFLELADTATTGEIKKRLAEKLAHFEALSEKAPSDFLRRLHLRNLTKIKIILQESMQWPSFKVTAETEPATPTVDKAVEEPALTMHIVASLKEGVKNRSAAEPVAWLISHTENQDTAAYPLKTGKNFVGRKLHPSLNPFIVIEGDDFISRLQCVIDIEEANPLVFYISDAAAFNNGKTSSNGSFINGNSEAVTLKQRLVDGDTIQLGMTKLVLKAHSTALQSLVNEVAGQAYINTVVIES